MVARERAGFYAGYPRASAAPSRVSAESHAEDNGRRREPVPENRRNPIEKCDRGGQKKYQSRESAENDPALQV